METDTIEAVQKLKNSMEIGRQFAVEEVNRTKKICNVPISVPENLIKKMIFRQNELDIE